MGSGAKGLSVSRLQQLFQTQEQPSFTEQDLLQAESNGEIPQRKRGRKSWPLSDVPKIGRRFGFMKPAGHPLVSSLFITKGGVLKSSLTLNLARMAALHNVKVCVIGLDMQGDITSALGYDHGLTADQSLEEALERINRVQGLPELMFNRIPLEEILQSTELPNLSFIPETPELVALEQSLTHRNRREFWLRDHVIDPLKDQFDWILIDCAPNWNQLITNALVASDVLISPLECKINNYRNFNMFKAFIHEFKRDMDLQFRQIYVPTRLSPGRKLSREILDWYQSQLSPVTSLAIRDSVQGEEATAVHMSLPEYAPQTDVARELNVILKEIWDIHVHASRPKGHTRARSVEAELQL